MNIYLWGDKGSLYLQQAPPCLCCSRKWDCDNKVTTKSSHYSVQLMYILHSIPFCYKHQILWWAASGCFSTLLWWNGFGTLLLPSPFLPTASAEKRKPSDSFSVHHWSHFTFPGVSQISCKKQKKSQLMRTWGLWNDKWGFRKLPTLAVNCICWASWGIKLPSFISWSWDFSAVRAAILTCLLTFCWVIHSPA